MIHKRQARSKSVSFSVLQHMFCGHDQAENEGGRAKTGKLTTKAVSVLDLFLLPDPLAGSLLQ